MARGRTIRLVIIDRIRTTWIIKPIAVDVVTDKTEIRHTVAVIIDTIHTLRPWERLLTVWKRAVTGAIAAAIAVRAVEILRDVE